MNQPRFENQTHCLNCQTELLGEYCSTCGQKKVSTFTFRHVNMLLQSAVLDLESPFFKLFVGLLIRPFETILGYLHGQRSRYGNPIKFSFILLTVIVLASHFFGLSFISNYTLVEAKQQTGIKLYEATHVYRVFVLALLLGIASKAIYRHSTYTMLEYAIGHLLILTITIFLFVVPLMFGLLNEQLYAALSFIFSSTYSLILNYKMDEHRQNIWRAGLRATIAYTLGTLTFSAITLFTIGVYTGLVGGMQ
ncbi:DUF3667 domain-containing protein [Pseudoalteromonas piscicida]|uniref:DUF3667 domain-containing protein n=1 Tax=Pseudoalteromonas piscicida TaxID=43662 RepID=UPI0030B512C6